jgi:BASS family bile acid:Na+ symporter
MSLLKLAVVLATIAVPLNVFADALRADLRDISDVLHHPGEVLRAFLAVVVGVPLLVVLVVALVNPPRSTVVGLALLAACPVAPLLLVTAHQPPDTTRLIRGLHLALASLAIVTVPLTLAALGHELRFRGEVSVRTVAFAVLKTLLVPMLLGLAVAALAPAFAARVRPALQKLGVAVLLAALAVILAYTAPLMFGQGVRSYAAMALMVMGALALGHLFAPPTPAARTALALEAATRNLGLVMVVVGSRATPRAALGVLMPYLLVFLLVTTLYKAWVKRQRASPGGRRWVPPGAEPQH